MSERGSEDALALDGEQPFRTASKRAGIVCLSGQPVGIIEEIGDQVRFTYSSDWLRQNGAVPISVTLPLRPEPYVTKGLHPFFENLLAEGWFLELASKRLKISKSDPFGLLLHTCFDCIGAVEIAPLEPDEGPRDASL
jgi:serine/threonine-protein kinase HipA